MDGQQVITLILGILAGVGTIFAIYFGIKSKRRNECQDSNNQGRNDGAILTELGYIKGGIDDLKKDVRETKEEQVKLKVQMATLETKVDNHIGNKAIHALRKKEN